MRPWLKTAMRSLIVSASPWSWVTKTNVMPTSRWICFSSICISSRSLQVERAERLVEQEDARPVHQRTGERDALALAAGQLVRLAVAEALEPDAGERLVDPGPALGLRRPA